MMESYSYQFLKIVVSLLVVLGMMGGVMVLLRFALQRRERTGTGRLPVKVLGRGFIGYKKDIVVVDVAGQTLILGVTADNIVCLGRLDDEDAIAELKSADRTDNSQLIEKILSRFNKNILKRKKVAG